MVKIFMRKIKIDIRDLAVVLETMIEEGVTEIIISEHRGLPAIADAENPQDLITFQVYNEEEETKDGDKLH